MDRKRVSEIEFHFTYEEIDDCIMRMADLILEGYTVSSLDFNGRSYSVCGEVQNPYMHFKLRRKSTNG